MPRTDAVAPPGCPALRALSFDNLGLIKVIQCSAENAQAQIVARWGEPSLQRSVVAVSLSSDKDCNVLAVARRNSDIELIDPASGAMYSEFNVRTSSKPNITKISEGRESVNLVGIHAFQAEASGSRRILTCTDLGRASIYQCFRKEGESEQASNHSVLVSWDVCKSGSILCTKVDKAESFAAFGGDGAEVSLYDIKSQSRIWESKAPRRDSNGLMSRPFFTAMTFLGNDHRKLVVGTGHHQVRLYEIGATRRPVLSFDFLESPIKAIERDDDGNTVFVGTGNGDIASFDMRSGKLLGSFKGKNSGSIRSITVHPSLPVVATCGLDRFLRVFHKSTRHLLTRVFLKQPLVATVFDTSYPIGPQLKSNLSQVIEEAEIGELVESGVEDSSTATCKPLKKRKTKKRKHAESLSVLKKESSA